MKSPERAEQVKAPDTGQSGAESQAGSPEEPQNAAASTSSPASSNSSNYNLVTSLLNLTKSPVSNLLHE